MKVFISWSGQLSKNIAEVLRKWIPGVIQAAKPYYSPDDVSKGARWSAEISKELDASKVGIICLTQDNLEAPWIMFEAGALSKNIDKSRVCPLLFGIDPSDIQGPLVQFQAAKFSKEEMYKVVDMVNTELGESGLAPDVLHSVFEVWWPQLNESVEKCLAASIPDGKSHRRSDRDLLEEILLLTRSATLVETPQGISAHTHVLEDLVGGYYDATQKMVPHNEHLLSTDAIQALKDIGRTLNHSLRVSDLPGGERARLHEMLGVAKQIIAMASVEDAGNGHRYVLDLIRENRKRVERERRPKLDSN